ncbi:MAG: type II toxin-antitoxin system RelE/ParE family toxin [Candidatus Bathyarchaeota archaeon]
MFRVQMRKRAYKRLQDLSPTHHNTIAELIDILKTDPVPYHDFDVAKLSGRDNDYRVRVGNIRAIYTIDWTEKIITISRLEFRGRAYKPR